MAPNEVTARLEEAGRTLLSLPPRRAQGHVKGGHWHMVEPAVRSIAWSGEPVRLTPSPQEIDRMDEALRWLALVPQDRYVLRRIVASRAMVSPLTGRHLFPWRRIAGVIGADHKAVQRWHAQGIGIIAERLGECRRAA